MALIFRTFVLLALVGVCFAALAQIPADTASGHPGHCNSDTTGPMKKGEVKQLLGTCTQADCNDDHSMTVSSCGVISSPCGLTDGDKSKPYPQCCPQPKDC